MQLHLYMIRIATGIRKPKSPQTQRATMKHMIFDIGDVPPEGGARVFPFFGRDVQIGRGSDLARTEAKRCPHLSDPLDREGGTFSCPWHGAGFDVKAPRRIDVPAAANARLMILPRLVEDGALVFVRGEAS
jgi:nitrite reductase/ring-hydroxylating ferredoxin subunit